MQIITPVPRNSCCVLLRFCFSMPMLLQRVAVKCNESRGFIFLSCLPNAKIGIGVSLKNLGLKEISVSKNLLLKKVLVSVSKILDSKKV